MTPRESHTKFTVFQQKIEAKFLPQVDAVIKDAVNIFVSSGVSAGGVHNITLTAMIPVLNNMYYQCGYGYGWSVYRQFVNVKSDSSTYQTKGTDPNKQPVTPSVLAQAVSDQLRMSLALNVKRMSDTLKRDILAKIEQGYTNGWGYEKTAQAVSDEADIVRARRIIRTESVKASNLSGMTGAKATGLLMDKRWISARDNRVRGNPAGKYANAEFDHWDINGTILPMDQDFSQTGEPLSYPGDPDGAPGDIINCRCSLGYIPKRDANGRPIRIAPGFFSNRVATMWPT